MRVAAATLTVLMVALVIGCGPAPTIQVPNPSTGTADQTSTALNGGSGAPTTTTPTADLVDPDLVLARASAQVENVLGLQAGAVTKSSEAPHSPALTGADAVLTWSNGGWAEVDLDTGRILSILPGSVASSSESVLPAELDRAASRVAEILGWDGATLATEGFTENEVKVIPHGDAPTEYSKRWKGHDEAGIPNQGMIDVALDTTSGALLHFFYHPGSRAALDASGAISKDEAIRIATERIGNKPRVPTTTVPPGASTTMSAPLGGLAGTAQLVHTDAPGITGGRDMLVWKVEFGESATTDEVWATVFIDAITGEVLTYWLS